MLPAFGKELRKLRLDHGELLKHMADKLGYSSSSLSAFEVGRRPIPNDLIARLASLYGLDDDVVQCLESAKALQSRSVSIGFDGVSQGQSDLALVFARQFKSLDETTTSQIMQLLNNSPKEG